LVSSTDISQWKSEATSELKDKISGIVLLVRADDVQQLVEQCVSDDPLFGGTLNLISYSDSNRRFPKFPFYRYQSLSK
jgi:hypothetical protein